MARRVTRRPSYRAAVRWIAHEDNAGGGDSLEFVRAYISTALVADLFGADQGDVAADVIRERRKVGLPVDDSDD